MWCDATTTTHPDTRCQDNVWLDGALNIRCERERGHDGKHRNADHVWPSIRPR